MPDLEIRDVAGAVVFQVKVIPGASRTQISGLLGDMLKIKVAAPAKKGKANTCIVQFLASQLSVKSNAVSIIKGQTSPIKHIKVTGISALTLLEKLNL